MIIEGLTIHIEKSWLCRISQAFPNKCIELLEFQPADDTRWRGIIRTAVDEDIQAFTEWVKNEVKDVTFLRCENSTCTKECKSQSGCSIAFSCPQPEFAKSMITHDVFLQSPVVLENGTLYLKVVSTDAKLKNFYTDLSALPDCEVHLIKKFKTEELSEALLTDKQKEIMKVAVELGYYKIPREITISELSKRVGISSSTLGEHLRKAEERIINSSVA